MKLYIFYNKEYEPMKEKFLLSLKDDYEVIAHSVRYDREFASGGGKPTWVTKTNIILKSIKENIGFPVIISDIDIIFFKKTESIVLDALQDADIVFQREYDKSGVNLGFVAMRCNNNTLRFWEMVLSQVQNTNCWDQLVVNKMLYWDKYNISWKRFPSQICNSTQSGLCGLTKATHFIWRLFKNTYLRHEVNMPIEYCADKIQEKSPLNPQPILTRTLCLYHANFSGHEKEAMPIKLNHLKLIEEYLKMPRGIQMALSSVYNILIRMRK